VIVAATGVVDASAAEFTGR